MYMLNLWEHGIEGSQFFLRIDLFARLSFAPSLRVVKFYA